MNRRITEFKKIPFTRYEINQKGEIRDDEGNFYKSELARYEDGSPCYIFRTEEGETIDIAKTVYILFNHKFKESMYYVRQLDPHPSKFFNDNLMLLKKGKGKSSAVMMFHKGTTKLVTTYPTVLYASKMTGIESANIYSQIKMKRSHCGDYMFVRYGDKIPVRCVIDMNLDDYLNICGIYDDIREYVQDAFDYYNEEDV